MYEQNGRKQIDVAVIGGGIAGLTAAAYLAQGGREVTLFEKANAIGGRARSVAYEDFWFNQGPHALYNGGEATDVLQELGIELSGGSPPVPKTWGLKGGELHRFPAGPLSLLTTRLMSVGQRIEFLQLLFKALRTEPASVAHVSTWDWLQQHSPSPIVREAILALLRLTSYANAPRELSAEILMRQFRLGVGRGVRYLDGGWQALVDALEETALQAGAVVHNQSRIVKISMHDQQPLLHLADGSPLVASSVVLAVDPATAHELLPDDRTLREVASGAQPVRMATLDIALRRLPRPERPIVLALDEPRYLSVHSAAAKLAPAGSELVHVAWYLDDETAGAETEPALEALLDLAQPGWRAELVHRRFLPEMVVVNNLVTAPEGLAGRPGPALPGTPHVYVAGDWVGNAGWLADAAFASARQAAQLLLQRSPRRIHSEPVPELSEVAV
jgi:phytoene dehydrogenase-like protein